MPETILYATGMLLAPFQNQRWRAFLTIPTFDNEAGHPIAFSGLLPFETHISVEADGQACEEHRPETKS
jgi:hypothetical protein